MTDPLARPACDGALVEGPTDPARLDDRLLRSLRTAPPLWFPALLVSSAGALLFVTAALYTVTTGIGTWGNQIPVAWAFGITNFVWWIGIGHAGTFVSAFLLLLEQGWRGSINRVAEAMTLFAVAIAATFPLLHLGRPWFFYWFLPYPSTMGVWPQWRSALVWDLFAVLTYATVSLLFWYFGLLPDLAAARDRLARPGVRRVYGLFALGWRGSARQWRDHRLAYGLLAGFATPLVVSVHTIVSFDFATGLVPGWHSTIFPPYFVIGALHSGFAMLLVLLVPIRAGWGLREVITPRHLEATASLLLVCGCLMGLCYATEAYVAWMSAEPAEVYSSLVARYLERRAGVGWSMLALNVAVPQILWWPAARRSPPLLLAVGLAVLLGMWLERFLLIAGALENDFLPSAWGRYTPTVVDGALLFGALGLFATLMLLFLRVVPFVPTDEVKRLAREQREGG